MYRQAIGQKHARVYEEMMSKRRKTKTFEMIYIDYRSPFYEVMYRDNNGVSILDKTKNKAVAERSMKKFILDRQHGKLLKENKRVWGGIK